VKVITACATITVTVNKNDKSHYHKTKLAAKQNPELVQANKSIFYYQMPDYMCFKDY